MKPMNAMSRRRLMQALGLGGCASFLPSLSGNGSMATADASTPSRLILFYTQHGPPSEQWQMPMGRDTSTHFEYDLSSVARDQFSRALTPLYDHRDQLLVVQGLSEMSHMEDERIHGRARHAAAAGSIYASAGRGSDDVALGPSIDHIVAADIAVPGRFDTLQYTNDARRHPSWQSAGSRANAERDVRSAFDRLFPAGAEPPSSMPTEQSIMAGLRGSVLDIAAEEFDHLRSRSRLSLADHRKLAAHQEAIRNIEARAAGIGGGLSCGDVSLPSNGENTRDMMELAALAMSCDLTRVATISARQLSGDAFGGSGDVHQNYAHHGNDPDKRRGMGDYYAKHAEDFAFLLDRLAAVPDGEGTLLDSTAVVWMTELGNGDHTLWDMMAVVAGGPFRKGRYLNYPMNRTPPLGREGLQVGRGTSELLLTVAQCVGSTATSIGKSSVMDVDGGTIRLDRILDELV